MKIFALLSKNDLDPKIYLIHNNLLPLNDIKEIFLARIYVVITIFKLNKSAMSYKGNILNIK